MTETELRFVPVGSVFRFATETMTVVENPGTTGDRYRVRVTCTPGGGPTGVGMLEPKPPRPKPP